MSRITLSRFRQDEGGSATIEAVLWMPFFFFFFVMVLDAAMIFTNHAQVLRMVQDGNRFYAVGAFTSCDAAEDWVRERVRAIAPTANVDCSRAGGVSTIRATMNTEELDLTGATGVFGGLMMVAQSQHMIEPGA